jgi:hypothetical protein
MRKSLFAIMIVLTFMLAGCTENEKNVDVEPVWIDYISVDLSAEKFNETYYEEIPIESLNDYFQTYVHKSIMTWGNITEIIKSGEYIILRLSNNYFTDSLWDFDEIFVYTNNASDISLFDIIDAYGYVGGGVYYKGEEIPYISCYKTVKLYKESAINESQEIKVLEYLNYTSPAYFELYKFINHDDTDKQEYDPENYHCLHYSRDLLLNARKEGFISGIVYLYPRDDPWRTEEAGHALLCFYTSDQGLVYVDPQMDYVFFEQDMNRMQAKRKYDVQFGSYYFSVDFDMIYREWYFQDSLSYFDTNYSNYANSLEYDLSWDWDYYTGRWSITYNGSTYQI